MEEIPLDPPAQDPPLDSTTQDPPLDPPAQDAPAQEPPAEVELTPEQLEELEKRRKRAEKFGTNVLLDEIAPVNDKPKNKPNRQKKGQYQMSEEELKKIEEREKKFGLVATRRRNDKHFENKVENPVSEDNKIRLDAIHIFGVDFLSTSDLMDFFKAYNPLKVEWINDSSCNIVFASEEVTQDAFKGLTLTKKYESNWRDSFPIEKGGVKFTLQFRFATEKDVKGEKTSGKTSRYYQFVKEEQREKRQNRDHRDNRDNRGNRRGRDDYDDRSGVMQKRISKKGGKKGKGNEEDEEEKNNPELKNLREEQIEEGLQEAAAEENNGENQDQQEDGTNVQNSTQNNETKDDGQDLEL